MGTTALIESRAVATRAVPAWWFLALYASLLLLVPTELVFPQLGSAGTPATLVGLALLLWWVCSRLAGLLPHHEGSPLHVALGLLAIVVLLSFASGLANGWSRPADIREATDAVWTLLPITLDALHAKSVLAAFRGLITIAGWLGAALTLMDGLRSWSDFDKFIAWFTWLTSGVAAIGIYQYFTGDNLARFIHVPGLQANYDYGVDLTRSVVNRVSATTTHPIEFSVVLTAILPLALHRAFYAGRDGAVDQVRVRTAIPAVLICLAIPMAVSRSGIVALAIATAILFAGWPSQRRIALLVLAPPVLVIMRAALPGLLGTIRALFTQSLTDPSVTARTSDYGVVFRLYSEHPILGRGAFTFMPQYYRTLDNQYLMNLVELGAVGLAMTLGLFGCGYYLARYVKRHATSEEHRHAGLALSASVAAMMFSYVTFDAWGFAKAGATTFVLLGLAGAAWRLCRADSSVMEGGAS